METPDFSFLPSTTIVQHSYIIIIHIYYKKIFPEKIHRFFTVTTTSAMVENQENKISVLDLNYITGEIIKIFFYPKIFFLFESPKENGLLLIFEALPR